MLGRIDGERRRGQAVKETTQTGLPKWQCFPLLCHSGEGRSGGSLNICYTGHVGKSETNKEGPSKTMSVSKIIIGYPWT